MGSKKHVDIYYNKDKHTMKIDTLLGRSPTLGANVFQQGEIPDIRIMYIDFEHSISIDFDKYIYIFQVF
jgi:hypothetical protein